MTSGSGEVVGFFLGYFPGFMLRMIQNLSCYIMKPEEQKDGQKTSY